MTKQKIEPRPRRRWVVIGPGIVIALVLALQVAINNHKTASGPPIIERQVVGSETAQVATIAPEIAYILQHTEELKLTDRQITSLTRLQAEWEVKSSPLTDQMDKAEADFRQFMESTGNKAAVQDIQSHAGTVSELSGQVSSLRRIYWEKAHQILDQKQQDAIERMLAPKPGSDSRT